MDIRLLFAVLVLCTAAVVAVVLAIHFRVKRHLRDNTVAAPEAKTSDESAAADVTVPSAVDDTGSKSNT